MSGPAKALNERARVALPYGAAWPPFALGTSTDLRWEWAHDSAIQRDGAGDVWHAGHVNAVAAYGPAILLATDTSGVWLVNPDFDAIPIHTGFPATALGWGWDEITFNALAPLEDAPSWCFAAGSGANPLRILELGAVLGGIEHKSTTTLPVPMSTIYAMLVLRGRRTLVVGGSDGVAFAQIPANPADAASYTWTNATGIPYGKVSGLAEGPAEAVIAALWGDAVAGSSNRGLFHGRIVDGSPPQLTFTGGELPVSTGFARTSVATCPANRSIGYAFAATDDDINGGWVAAILRTDDGGSRWTSLPNPSKDHLGWYANCIAVHPTDPSTVAFAMSGGPFVSINGGQYWVNRNQDPMHSDVHGLTFAAEPTGAVLWAATDGGVFRSEDLGATWDSRWNRHLLNLQFYGDADAFDACPGGPDLIFAGATQDNGDLYCGPNDRAWTSLRQLAEGDGKATVVVRDASCLHSVNTDTAIRRRAWGTFGYTDSPDNAVPADGNAAGLSGPVLRRVVDPQHDIAGSRVVAYAGLGRTLYAYLESGANDDGSFRTVGTVPPTIVPDAQISAVGSGDGTSVLVGVGAAIVRFDVAGGAAPVDETVATPLTAAIAEIDVTHADSVYALTGQALARRVAGTWATGPPLGRPINRIAAHPGDADVVYASADDGVWVTVDGGQHWTITNTGLPRKVQGRGLTIAPGEDGWRLLLSTYGWGVFAASLSTGLPSRPPIPVLTREEARILFGIIQDGGGLELIGGRLVRVPPRQPARELALLMGVHELSRRLGKRGTRIREAVLRAID
jgi:photosystem II stability/assembly factor-like uncharacterized protein